MGTWPISAVARLASEGLGVLQAARRAGMFDPAMTLAASAAYATWGASPATGFSAASCRFPKRAAVIDDRGSLTFADLGRRTDAMAAGLADLLPSGATVGLLARNHRGFVEAHLAATKAGARTVLLNTGFAAPQLADVLARESVDLLLHDAEFNALVGEAAPDRPNLIVDEPGDGLEHPSLDALAIRYAGKRPPRRRAFVETVLLTSGTTGVPKGARRPRPPRDPRAGAGLLAAVPYTVGDTVVVPAPLFHAWGFAHYVLAGALGMTLVLQRNFTPEGTLELVDRYRAQVLAVVPVMLQRILALGPDVINRYDHSRLRVVASSGSALPGRLATEWMSTFGDTLYNLYGSTEVGQATVATPADLRAAPGTAGRPVMGTTVKLLDDADKPVPDGQVGRIFVGSGSHFDGYTGGGTKPRVGHLMSTGDVGYIDRSGRLYVGGRDDDMIISGGENVFPREVEDLLVSHLGIADAAVMGVPDDEFGQRLSAWVVLAPGADLNADDVRDLVRTRLARHKVPRDVYFLDELPRNASGKLLRPRLSEVAGRQ